MGNHIDSVREGENGNGVRHVVTTPAAERLRGAGCPPELCARVAHLERRGRLEEGVFELAAERDRLVSAARSVEERLACLDEVILSTTSATKKGRRHDS